MVRLVHVVEPARGARDAGCACPGAVAEGGGVTGGPCWQGERGVQPARDPAALLQTAVTAADHTGAQSDFKNSVLTSESQIENVLL